MGEEKKEEEKKEESKEEKKEEEKKEEEKKDEEQPPQEIVLKVDMHCEACARKVAKALKGFEGVEEVSADSKSSKVVVKGKAADPIKVLKRLQKKSGKKVELISPLPKPQEEKKEEEIKEPPKPEEKKDEGPTVVTIVLKIRMHCDACAQVIQKRIRKIKGVESVETDLGNDQAIVKGVIDPAKLVDEVYKRTKKQATIVKEEEEKKEEEKKEEEKKEEKKEGEEEKKESGEENKEDEDDNKTEIKRSEYWPSKDYIDYAYAPEIFSDENPNACAVM
ncbi:heavy metal-associated isoprenylated plant protein 7-like isoform X1 [Vicia villosa]|uniref:heavy metal-associated isoprenylated plant protein 7-like isoform X1 n=1 Tax=Vicia villosa TaxID=3911 RepID=UPI00273CCEF6|nr:heavy metal-associated isoprenylated plant protein 7-like isoform X1 [Vicia villosa]